MNTSAIIRLNIERFQQMLQTESDESTRRVIEKHDSGVRSHVVINTHERPRAEQQ